MWDGTELSESRIGVPIESHERPEVTHLVAIVRGRKHSDALAVVLDHVPCVLHLVTADQQT